MKMDLPLAWSLMNAADNQNTLEPGPAATADTGLSATGENTGDIRFMPRYVGLLLVGATLLCGAASFIVLTGLTSLQPTGQVVTMTIIANGLFVAALIALIAREFYMLRKARQRARTAARLHIRIVGLFSLVAAVPAILVAIVAAVSLDLGLDRWFEGRTRAIVGSSISVAQSYLNESIRGTQNNTISMAIELDNYRQLYILDRTGFTNLMTIQARGRGMLGAWLLRLDGSVIISAVVDPNRSLPRAPEDTLIRAREGDPVLIPPGKSNVVGGLIRMQQIADTILYTVRPVDPVVMDSLRIMEDNTLEYRGLASNRGNFQLAFALIYTGICLIVFLSAIWMGINVADRIVGPIRRLITAADGVAAGDMSVRVSATRTEGDLRSLSNTFNKMIIELKSQRDEILAASADIDNRRRFMEAVLSGVSAGVIGLNRNGEIAVTNRSAIPLLTDENKSELVGRNLKDISPELWKVFQKAVRNPRVGFDAEITLLRGGQERNLSVKVTEEEQAFENSYVITIDDITNLVAAQRNTAWADVARRIAHEIRNPLTPIQLSAERIRRRYGHRITDDREVFDQCTDTIIRQVADIGRMVDEFSSFARMPKPVMVEQDLRKVAGEAIFLQRVANPDIEFKDEMGDAPVVAKVDPRLLSQAFTNVIKNAVEAIAAVPAEQLIQGRVVVRTHAGKAGPVIDVIDNGKGLPDRDRHKLLEPYVTNRVKGTGLGLAIVRKIMEDHQGTIELLDAPQANGGGRGATVRLSFPEIVKTAENKTKPVLASQSRKGKKLTTRANRRKKANISSGEQTPHDA